MSVDSRIEIQIPVRASKVRLDEFLFEHFSGLSKMYLRRVVNELKCEVNGRNENVGYRLRSNDFVEIELDLTRETSMRPQEIPLHIIFEDGDLLIVNKAAGMLVHPTNRDKSGTLLNALSYYLNEKQNSSGESSSGFASIRPGLIHRLDKQTSGLIVVAKNQKAHKKMTEFFRKKYIEKRYLALVDGVVEADDGMIDARIGRFGEKKYWDVKPDGKESETRYWVRQRNAKTTLLELEPITGRTNQLRIHLASIGHPIVGDAQREGSEYERLCLHAWKLAFRHPLNGESLAFRTSIPAGFEPSSATGSDEMTEHHPSHGRKLQF